MDDAIGSLLTPPETYREGWGEARNAIQHGLVVSQSMDSYIDERLLALRDSLRKNGV
jgi:hypothetical protein